MNGTDLIPEILRRFKGRKAAIFGTQEPYLSKAVIAVEKLGVEVVVCADGFQAEETYGKLLSDRTVDLIVLGMGVPKQEKVSLLLAQTLMTPAVILNGGAILDFLAQRFPRAPRIVRALRLEWFYRLVYEPRRLWRRYFGSIPELVECACCLRLEARGGAWK